MQKTSDTMSKQVLSWAKIIEEQRAQKAMVITIQETTEFYMIRQGNHEMRIEMAHDMSTIDVSTVAWHRAKKMPNLWEMMHRMPEKQAFPEGL